VRRWCYSIVQLDWKQAPSSAAFRSFGNRQEAESFSGIEPHPATIEAPRNRRLFPGYRGWRVENVDVGCSYYYDATSGDLVAVFCEGTSTMTCLGGPPDFTEPACAALQLQDYAPVCRTMRCETAAMAETR
jgi:hypothetical protein